MQHQAPEEANPQPLPWLSGPHGRRWDPVVQSNDSSHRPCPATLLLGWRGAAQKGKAHGPSDATSHDGRDEPYRTDLTRQWGGSLVHRRPEGSCDDSDADSQYLNSRNNVKTTWDSGTDAMH
jgi:hypothetical protein